MLLLIDKPTWYTCGDIIRKLKKLYPDVKIGHSWALDPMATGLLIIWFGRDTKKLARLQQLPKEYETIIDFSLETDTWDKDWYQYYKKYKVVWMNDIRWLSNGLSDDFQTIKKGLLIEKQGSNTEFVPMPSLEQIKEKLKKIKIKRKKIVRRPNHPHRNLNRNFKNISFLSISKVFFY